MSDYPAPSYAATAWVTGNTLWLSFGPLAQGEKGHSVPYEIDLPALRALASKDRAVRSVVLALETLATRHHHSSIGTKGSPVAYDIERALANDKKYIEWMRAIKRLTPEEVAEGDKELRELGL